MSLMWTRSERAERLLGAVETVAGSGEFVTDSRLRVEEVQQRSDGSVSTARISVLLTDGSDSEEVRRVYHPDRRLIVTTEHPNPRQREILFEGYPPVQTSRWDGRVDHEAECYVFEAESVWERFSRAREAWVYGRRMRSGAIEDGLIHDPGRYAAACGHFTALPCIFNPDGAGNRATEPLVVSRPGAASRQIPIFAVEGHAAAPWTYAAVLRYLVWFGLIREGPVFEGNVFDCTDALMAGSAGEGDALSEALRREPVSLDCEAMSLVDALARAAAVAGIHVTAETVTINGCPRTQLRAWSPRSGSLRKLYLVRGGRHADGRARYDASTRSVREVLRDNNTYRGEVGWDHRAIVNHAIVMGDIRRYEVTVPLRPGWLPTANLDNVAVENRDAAKYMALTPGTILAMGPAVVNDEWFRKYHRDGDLYLQHADVGRLWVLNEDGGLGAAYDRNPPFDHYGPFDFAALLPSGEMGPGGWTRRRRVLGRTLTVGTDGQSLGVHVEISFDSGATWSPAGGPILVARDRAAIHFDAENPTQITPRGIAPEDQNLWYAIIDQTLRVRVTAVIEGDQRLISTFGPTGLGSPTQQVNVAIISRPRSFKYASRVASGLATGLPAGGNERDDSAAVAELARWLARTRQDRQVRVAPTIPWIETAYGIGERITEIAGRCLRLATTVATQAEYPCITERRFSLQDGRYETTLTLVAADLPENVA